jgi:hypothetical protein
MKAMLDHADGDVTSIHDRYELAEKRSVVDLRARELRRIEE